MRLRGRPRARAPAPLGPYPPSWQHSDRGRGPLKRGAPSPPRRGEVVPDRADRPRRPDQRLSGCDVERASSTDGLPGRRAAGCRRSPPRPRHGWPLPPAARFPPQSGVTPHLRRLRPHLSWRRWFVSTRAAAAAALGGPGARRPATRGGGRRRCPGRAWPRAGQQGRRYGSIRRWRSATLLGRAWGALRRGQAHPGARSEAAGHPAGGTLPLPRQAP